jgi:hypothetical protein
MKIKNDKNVEVVRSDLKALLFWAKVGVINNKGGSYSKNIIEIIKSYSKFIGFDKTLYNIGRLKFKN